MEKKIHLYIRKYCPALWLACLCLIASVVVRIAVCSRIGEGLWGATLLAAFATLLMALLVWFQGEQRLYRTAIPVWLLGIALGWRLWSRFPGWGLLHTLVCICILFFCLAYTVILDGRIRWTWLLLPMELGALAVTVWIQRRLCLLPIPVAGIYFVLPEYLLIAGLLLLLAGTQVHTDEAYHPTWGDRPDGRRIRSIPAIDQIGPYIMVNRTGANNLFSESVEITQLERYVRAKRREGLTGFGMTHVILAAYVRTVAKYPALNRFIAGQKLYSRGEDISVSMTVKKELSTKSPDTVIKAHFSPGDTAQQVYEKFNAQVEEAKNTPLDSDMDHTAGVMTMIPGIFLKFVVWLLKTLDYFGLVPGFLLEISPFHGSAYFTSMGSLGIRPVYHHLYDFGTIPVFCAFGRKRWAEELEDGQRVVRKYVELKFNLDERICDAYYYACVIKHFCRLLSHPEVLDQPPETIERDIP